MNYIVYDKLTGKILRTGGCPSSMIYIQAHGENEAVIEGTANDAEHKIVNGQVVSKDN